MESDVLEEYVVEQLLGRLETEPEFLARSAAALDATNLDEDLAQEVEELESDPEVLFDVVRASRATWSELEPEAHRLLIIYTMDEVVVGSPSTPVGEMFDIQWRVKRPS